MKNYTFIFLIITLVTLLLGYTGLDYPGATVVRFICLVAGITLFLSCLDSVLISKNMRRFKRKRNRKNALD